MNMNSNRQTVRELIPAIGAHVAVRFESIEIKCRVLDAKNAYGKVRLLIEPISGNGSQWIELSRVASILIASDVEAMAAGCAGFKAVKA